jgi:thiol-disulfide isomerase/thioredoxin
MSLFTIAPRLRVRWPLALLSALGLAFIVACNSSAPTNSTASDNTPRGATQPRTQPPLPPIASAHGPSSSSTTDAPRTAAQSWTMLDGRRVQAADYKGKVLVLDFWATYCPPCRDEVPHLVALQKRYGAQGLNVVGLNVGGDDDRPKVPAFVREFGIQYPLGYPDEAMSSVVFANDDRIPQTYVFDRNGRLVKRFIGFDEEAAAGLEDAVQSALATKTATGGD